LGNGLALDIRAGIRARSASRAVSTAAVLTLMLAMGAMTALLTVVNGLILRPLPVSDPQRLVSTITSETARRLGFQGGAGGSDAIPRLDRAIERMPIIVRGYPSHGVAIT